SFYSFTQTPTTHAYTLSLHDALPISRSHVPCSRISTKCRVSHTGKPRLSRRSASRTRPLLPRSVSDQRFPTCGWKSDAVPASPRDRKSTRLNSSHVKISYAVFCLKKK